MQNRIRAANRLCDCLVLGAFALLVLAGMSLAQEPVGVTVEAESEISEDAAIQKALRNAVREAAGVFLDSHTKVHDFELIRDSIYSRAAGYVRSYKVLEKKSGLGDTFIVRVYAEVAQGSIESDFLATKNLIELVGRPRFWVEVKELAPGLNLTAERVRTLIVGKLENGGFTVVDKETYDEEVKRQAEIAKVNGDFRKAALLALQLKAVIGLTAKVVEARQWDDSAFNVPLTNYKVELTATVVERDTAEVRGSVNGQGMAQDRGKIGKPDMLDACIAAVENLYPAVRERILFHWLEDLDVGRAIAVQVCDAPLEVISDLKAKLLKFEGVTQANITETLGIATIRVIGRVKGEDILPQVSGWTGGKFKAELAGPNVVVVEPVSKQPGTPAAGGPGKSVNWGSGADIPGGGQPSGTVRSGYVLPAALLGGCVLLGIILAAIILRKGKAI